MAHHDACTFLDDDHNEAIRLFEQYKSERDDGQREVLASKIAHALTVHMQIEEEIFYPAFQRATGDEALLKDAQEEHQEARDLLSKIDRDRKNAKLMLELEDAILHHVNDEREKMFPKAKSTQGMDLMRLADQLEARKAELMVKAMA
jgi:iron-sulfur cluster repair protein YtfE (RIC family)